MKGGLNMFPWLSRIENFLWRLTSTRHLELNQAYKWPTHAKIVVLNNRNPFLDGLIKRQFLDYGVVDGKLAVTQAPTEATQVVAERLIETSVRSVGALVYDYPTSQKQALELDQLLDGVNLAVYYKLSDSLKQRVQNDYHKCSKCGQIYNHALNFITPKQEGFHSNVLNKYKRKCKGTACVLEKATSPAEDSVNPEVLKYYEDKGLLYVLEITEEHANLHAHEFHSHVSQELTASIKV